MAYCDDCVLVIWMRLIGVDGLNMDNGSGWGLIGSHHLPQKKLKLGRPAYAYVKRKTRKNLFEQIHWWRKHKRQLSRIKLRNKRCKALVTIRRHQPLSQR
jgi:hypothetical protein